jgi:hypothetical protein
LREEGIKDKITGKLAQKLKEAPVELYEPNKNKIAKKQIIKLFVDA